MEAKATLWQDLYILLFSPVVRLCRFACEVIFCPRQFASEALHLGDRTNFIRQGRFFIEACASALVLTSISATVTEQWIISSEIRYWALTLFITAVFLVILFGIASVAIQPRPNFRNVLHVFLPISGAVILLCAFLRLVYRAGLSLVDTSAGTNFSEFVPPDAFNAEFTACAINSSAVLRLLFGTSVGIATGKSGVVTFLESGGAGYIGAIWATAAIGSDKFLISKARASMIALACIVSTLLSVFTFVIVLLFVATWSGNCANIAYENIGKKSPPLLLQVLANAQRLLLPLERRSGIFEIEVSASSTDLVITINDLNHYDNPEKVEELERRISTNVYCEMGSDPEYYNYVLRSLGLGVVERWVVSRHDLHFEIQLKPGDCRFNYASGRKLKAPER